MAQKMTLKVFAFTIFSLCMSDTIKVHAAGSVVDDRPQERGSRPLIHHRVVQTLFSWPDNVEEVALQLTEQSGACSVIPLSNDGNTVDLGPVPILISLDHKITYKGKRCTVSLAAKIPNARGKIYPFTWVLDEDIFTALKDSPATYNLGLNLTGATETWFPEVSAKLFTTVQ